MSQREQIIALLDNVPDYKIGYVLAYIQGLTADEEADERFCQQMYERYLNDPDPNKHDSITLEELAKQLDVEL